MRGMQKKRMLADLIGRKWRGDIGCGGGVLGEFQSYCYFIRIVGVLFGKRLEMLELGRISVECAVWTLEACKFHSGMSRIDSIGLDFPKIVPILLPINSIILLINFLPTTALASTCAVNCNVNFMSNSIVA